MDYQDYVIGENQLNSIDSMDLDMEEDHEWELEELQRRIQEREEKINEKTVDLEQTLEQIDAQADQLLEEKQDLDKVGYQSGAEHRRLRDIETEVLELRQEKRQHSSRVKDRIDELETEISDLESEKRSKKHEWDSVERLLD